MPIPHPPFAPPRSSRTRRFAGLLAWLTCLIILPAPAANALELYALYNDGTSIGKYDAATGAALSAPLISGLNYDQAMAVDTAGYLYVARYVDGTIAKYDAVTGNLVNANFITGLSYPTALAISTDGYLYVANFGSKTVGKYKVSSGEPVNASLITGLANPWALAVDTAGNLYVNDIDSWQIGKYNASTGEIIKADFIKNVQQSKVATDSAGYLYVSTQVYDFSDFMNFKTISSIGKYQASNGASVSDPLISNLDRVTAMAIDTAGTLYVSTDAGTSQVSTFNTSDGTSKNLNFISTGYGYVNAFALYSPCGNGIAYTTGQWQQFALPCVPSASPASIANVLGNAATDVVNLPDGTYGSKWTLYGRNATNSGNVQLAKTATLASEAGYWFKSLTAPIDGKLQIAAGTATPVETGITGCQSANGCAVIPVATGTAAARMIGNPFPYNVDWSQVRVRVGGLDGQVYTPSEADAAQLVDKQIWIWNGASYETWDDDADPGNLQYFKSFFIKVMTTGVGKTIDLLIPAAASSVPMTALPTGFAERLAATARAWSGAVLDWLIPPAAADEPAAGWKVRLRVENPKTGAKARALLGQRAGAEPGYDPADLTALAPFASPYLTLVFPQPGWGANKGDYGSDFRPADGVAEQWNLDLRGNPVGSQVVLRWEGDPAVLARSRLIDGKTVIDPANPAYANGYPLTLKTSIRALRWEYLGD